MPNLPKNRDSSPEAPPSLSFEIGAGSIADSKNPELDDSAIQPGHALFQDSFFFCKFKPFGCLQEATNVFVEAVVDSDYGFAFAKVYSARSAINAVDILTTRVAPFFQRLEIPVREIRTRNTREYCGVPPGHAYETYLATSHIEHRPLDLASHRSFDFCGQFYSFLEKKFLQPSLRGKFRMSLPELQQDLDAFLESYNAHEELRQSLTTRLASSHAKFPVDP